MVQRRRFRIATPVLVESAGIGNARAINLGSTSKQLKRWHLPPEVNRSNEGQKRQESTDGHQENLQA